MITQAINVEEAVDAALPVVRQHVDEIHERRRLPDAVVDALRDTGINRMVLPGVLGGLETPTADVMKVLEKISAVDGSTGWCAIIGAGSNIFAGYISEIGAREVFADPDQSSATVFAPTGTLEDDRGRLLLTGRWAFVSNCLHSEWLALCAELRRGNEVEPAPRLVFVRAADVTIEDTWDVVGLRGTGSHHVAADHVVVDPEHCCIFVGEAWPDGPSASGSTGNSSPGSTSATSRPPRPQSRSRRSPTASAEEPRPTRRARSCARSATWRRPGSTTSSPTSTASSSARCSPVWTSPIRPTSHEAELTGGAWQL